jgi:hypothetical protein
VSAFDNQRGDKVMKSICKASLLKMLVLFVGALGASALPALAQNTTGTFTLAHKVRWGTAVLPAGDYAFSVDTQAWPARVMVRELGGTGSAMILSQAYSDQKLADGSTLVIEQKAGESVVSSLKLGPVGLALEFYSVKPTTPAETASLAPIADSQPGK